MTKCRNLVVNYDAIFGMTVASVQTKGTNVNPSLDKAKVKTKTSNDSKALHLRKIKIT